MFRRRKWFQGRPIMGERADDIEWFTPEGATMTEDDWGVSYARSIGVFLNGDAITAVGTQGQRDRRRQLLRHLQRLRRAARLRAARRPLRRALGRSPLDTEPDDLDAAFPRRGPRGRRQADQLTVAGRAVVVLRAIAPA